MVDESGRLTPVGQPERLNDQSTTSAEPGHHRTPTMKRAEREPPTMALPQPADEKAPPEEIAGALSDRVTARMPPLDKHRTTRPWRGPRRYLLAAIFVVGLTALVEPDLGAAITTLGGVALGLGTIPWLATRGQPWPVRSRWAVVGTLLMVLGVTGFAGSMPAYRLSIRLARVSGGNAIVVAGLRHLGETPPYSQELASAYVQWAQQETRQGNYAAAVDHLDYVETAFPTLPQAELAREQLPDTLLAWAKVAQARGDTIRAGEEYLLLLTRYNAFPAAALAYAQDAAGSGPSSALFGWAALAHAAHDYSTSDMIYNQLLQLFPQSDIALRAFDLAATNQFDWAQALNAAGLFDIAAQHYLIVLDTYSDTIAATEARIALSHGVSVVGYLLQSNGVSPVMAMTTVRLSSQYSVLGTTTVGAMGTYTVGGNQFLADTNANGAFVFTDVPPGVYLFEWRDTQGVYHTRFTGSVPALVVTVRTTPVFINTPIISDQSA